MQETLLPPRPFISLLVKLITEITFHATESLMCYRIPKEFSHVFPFSRARERRKRDVTRYYPRTTLLSSIDIRAIIAIIYRPCNKNRIDASLPRRKVRSRRASKWNFEYLISTNFHRSFFLSFSLFSREFNDRTKAKHRQTLYTAFSRLDRR